jgi:2,3-bisphosphoglycerate-dependent phosphoglycerate mutase
VSRLVLVRHGQSVWNRENRFTGWVDVDLTDAGAEEARRAGRLLRAHGVFPDVAHTSLLRRAILTTTLALDAADRLWIPQERSWRLNERHYGALAGLDKTETAERYGAEQVFLWRRSYSVRPPRLDDLTEFRSDPRYRDLADTDLPGTESLEDVEARLLPYWFERIVPQLAAGLTVLVGAHGNSLRALVKHIESIPVDEVVELEIATGVPRLYECSVVSGAVKVSSPVILTEPAANVAR